MVNASVLLTFKCFNVWAETRLTLKGSVSVFGALSITIFLISADQSCKQWDWFWITALGLYYFSILFLVFKSVHILDLPFVAATAYQADCVRISASVKYPSKLTASLQVRLLMKIHSFVRNNAPEVIKQSKLSNTSKIKVSKQFNRFLYFLYAPTLIYKEEYPRYISFS